MGVLDLIFPKVCLGCKKGGKYICDRCIAKVPPVKQVCPVCLRASIDGFTHVKCTSPFCINGIVSLWSYKGVIRSAIISLKYKFVEEISKELVQVSLHKLSDLHMFKNSPILTTVPLFWTRENIRGYNQIDKIAKTIATNFNLNYYPNLLFRRKSTTPQVDLSKEERIKNIRGVFLLNPKSKNLIRGSLVTILDDVCTTGSTLREAAKILKRSGAGEVWGLTIAR